MTKLIVNFEFCEKVKTLMFLLVFCLSHTHGFLGHFISVAVEDIGTYKCVLRDAGGLSGST